VVRGVAVHIGARVAATSQAGDVLVSQTGKDVAAGSGFRCTDAGEHELRGSRTGGASIASPRRRPAPA